MFTIMFDPHFKLLQTMENNVKCGDCIHFVSKYDVNLIIPILVIVFEVLNPII
jgi:hypothetical protein